MRRILIAFAATWLLAAGLARAQAPAPAPEPAAPPAAPAAAAPAPVPITDADIKSVSGPSADDKVKGDPAGTITGTVNDIPVGDAKKGLTVADVVNTVGQNVIASNFIWTLVTGFLVMFMQAPNTNLGGLAPLNHEVAISLFGKNWGLFGTQGMMLAGATYDVGVMVMFLFQMVFMDTALTIVTGTAAERWRYSAFIISSFFMGAFTYPIYGNWAWGGGWLATLGASYGLGHGYCDFAGSGVVHAVGGVTALAMAILIGPRIGKYTREGKPNAIPGHDIVLVLLGCFILA
ncbi:MAG: ammonium transporter, partial [Acidobacteria bacterium]